MRTRAERAREIIEAMFPKEASLEDTAATTLFLNALPQVQIEAPVTLLESWKTLDGFLFRKDSPHFQGDEYHVHAPLPGGKEASWGVSGVRRHPGKFPASVPKGLSAAAAKLLGVPTNLLEFSWIEEQGEKTLLIEVKQ